MPLNRIHLAEAARTVIETMPIEHQSSLLFWCNTPGDRWIRSFQSHQSAEHYYVIPSTLEAKRYTAVNAETLVSNFVTLKRLVQKNSLDDERV